MSTTTKERIRPPKVTVAIVTEAEALTEAILKDVKEMEARVLKEHKAALDGLVHALGRVQEIELLELPTPRTDFVVMARHVYEHFLELIEDKLATDAHARAASEERVPLEVVERLLAGESPIRVWREHRKMTLDQLGAAASLSKSYLSDLENGKRAGPVETLQAIARALGVSLDDLAPAKTK